MPKVLYQEKEGKENLPPAGDEQRDVLKERLDKLEQKAEELVSEYGLHKYDESKLQVDNEIAQHYNREYGTLLHVTNARPDREYCWANAVVQNGIDVYRKQALGWQVVSGNDKECDHLKDITGKRRIGDAILMWIPKDKKRELDARLERNTRAKIDAVTEPLEAIASETGGLIKMRTNTGEERIGSRDEIITKDVQNDIRKAMRKEAARVFGEMARSRIPGLPLPGE